MRTDGQTDRYDEVNIRFSKFYERAQRDTKFNEWLFLSAKIQKPKK